MPTEKRQGVTNTASGLSPLWPCGKGCYNLLCQLCGTQQDGCTLHKRKEPCGKWFQHWGLRRFEGLCERQASTECLTAGEMAQYHAALAMDSCGPQPTAPPLALTNAAAHCLRAAQAHGGTVPDAQQPDSNAEAPRGLPMGLSDAQRMLLTPQLLPDGTTLYPGETTQVQHEPNLLDLQDIDLPGATHTSPLACHHPDDIHLDARLPDLYGNPLDEYIDPNTQEKWLCHPGHNDMVCWVKDYPAYIHPAIGVSQAEADALAAAEVARRAADEAAHQADVAQAAEMRATALAKEAAARAEADLRDKEAAATAAAATARNQLQRYDVAAAQADADASHRAHRLAIAHAAEDAPLATAAAPIPASPALVPSAPATGEGSTVPAIDAQALQALAPQLAPAAPRVIPAGPAPGILDRLGRSIACYAHAGGGSRH